MTVSCGSPCSKRITVGIESTLYREAVAGLSSDDVDIHVPGTGANAGDHRGRVGVFAFLEQAARRTGGTLRIRLHDLLVGEEHAAAALGGTCLLRASRLGNSA